MDSNQRPQEWVYPVRYLCAIPVGLTRDRLSADRLKRLWAARCALCFRRVAMTSRFYKVGEVKDTGDRVRSYDLRVMSPARFRCATPVKSAAFYVRLTLPPIGIDPMPAF